LLILGQDRSRSWALLLVQRSRQTFLLETRQRSQLLPELAALPDSPNLRSRASPPRKVESDHRQTGRGPAVLLLEEDAYGRQEEGTRRQIPEVPSTTLENALQIP